MRLILLGFLLHCKDQLCVGGGPVYSQMGKNKSQQFSQLSVIFGLQENSELLRKSRNYHGIYFMNKKRVYEWGGLFVAQVPEQIPILCILLMSEPT